MFKDLKSILPKTIKRAGISDKIDNLRVLELYSEIVKPIAENSENVLRPIYIKGDVLTVAALSQKTVRDLQYFEHKIVEEINIKMGKKVIEKINYIT